jgi:hypothetical protein
MVLIFLEPQFLHRCVEGREDAVEQGHQVRGRHPGRHRREIHHVGEEHGCGFERVGDGRSVGLEPCGDLIGKDVVQQIVGLLVDEAFHAGPGDRSGRGLSMASRMPHIVRANSSAVHSSSIPNNLEKSASVRSGGIGDSVETATNSARRRDAGKLAAMQGHMLAESVRSGGYAPLWDEGKLEAMKGRVLAESSRIEDPAVL